MFYCGLTETKRLSFSRTQMAGELRLPVQLVVVTWDMFSNGKGLRCQQMNATVSTVFQLSLFPKILHHELKVF